MLNYSYVCLYAKDLENKIWILIATKNKFAYWFDTTEEEAEGKPQVKSKVKGKLYNQFNVEIEGHYFAFFPENEGCPLTNGPEKICLMGGEAKKNKPPEESALEEFWEESGIRLEVSHFLSHNFHGWDSDQFGIYFIEVSMEHLQTVEQTANENYQFVKESDIPRVRGNDYRTILPRVFSNEINSVQILSLEDATTDFQKVDPKIAGWFVMGLVRKL
jgi:8-oxo-dGTP pyrophosphatase MutT (NUDIX family)